MEARATDFLDIRKAEQETKSRRGHYAAVAKRQKEQLEVMYRYYSINSLLY